MPQSKTITIAPGADIENYPINRPGQTLGLIYFVLDHTTGQYRRKVQMIPDILPFSPSEFRRGGFERSFGIKWKTLRRLASAGFIRTWLLTPGQQMWAPISYLEHLDRVAADPDFWTEERRQRYKDADPARIGFEIDGEPRKKTPAEAAEENLLPT